MSIPCVLNSLPIRSSATVIAGGASYSELRSIYEVMRDTGKEVILATTSVIKPKEYLDSVFSLDRMKLATCPVLPEEKKKMMDEDD